MIEESNVLREAVDKFYSTRAVNLRPLPPYVLVRALPKSQKVGSLWLPDKQNKVIHEGIVLATFKPYWRVLHGTAQHDGEDYDEQILVQPSVKVGDLILFQHFEGIPVEHVIFRTPYFKTQTYILVGDDPNKEAGRRGIIGVLEEAQEETSVLLAKVLEENADANLEVIVDAIIERFVISPIEETSRTTSGR